MSGYHLAQVNIGRMKGPLESEVMEGFVARLDEINGLADRSPGFVWRLQSEEGDATALRVFNDDSILINLSVWESMQALHDYVYASTHRELLRDRARWFERMTSAALAMWWVPIGNLPTAEEAKQRLLLLQEQGPGPEAFTFARPFGPPGQLSGSQPLEECPWIP